MGGGKSIFILHWMFDIRLGLSLEKGFKQYVTRFAVKQICFKIKEYIEAEHYKFYSSWLNAYALLRKKII